MNDMNGLMIAWMRQFPNKASQLVFVVVLVVRLALFDASSSHGLLRDATLSG